MFNSFIPDDQLILYNSEGLIPGPLESEDEFAKRANFCLELEKNVSLLFKQKQVSFIQKFNHCQQKDQLLHDAFKKTKRFYDVTPSWVPLFFGNDKLAPWHGGCAWIFQVEERSPTSAFLQLRQAFLNSSRYLGIYKREELVAHEIAHVGRMMFQEPKFEEILAYSCSDSRFRQWLGPLVQSSFEALFFMLVLFAVIFFDLFLLISGDEDGLKISLWSKLFPVALLICGVVRLWLRQRQFTRCVEHLYQLLKDRTKVNAVVYRLTDQEIINFGTLSSDEIREYAKRNQSQSLRWRLIFKAYF